MESGELGVGGDGATQLLGQGQGKTSGQGISIQISGEQWTIAGYSESLIIHVKYKTLGRSHALTHLLAMGMSQRITHLAF